MTMYTSSDILCITNRCLCGEDFLTRIEKLAACHPHAIVLREKDLSPEEYRKLAAQVVSICQRHGTECILHHFVEIARELDCQSIHLPLPVLRGLSARQRAGFAVLGASCHSVEDAVEAESLGCTYITAGHVFDTDCKRGLPGRGLDFLRDVTAAVSIPVYAIGGIRPDNVQAVRQAGAAGACVMSQAMNCEAPDRYLAMFSEPQRLKSTMACDPNDQGI